MIKFSINKCKGIEIHESRGFTLVELMVSMFLASIVLGGLFAFSISSNRVFQSNSQVGMTQLVSRTALDIMAVDLQMAGLGTADPARIPDLPEADRDEEMAFGAGTVNSTTGSDAIQIRASLGAMAILREQTSVSDLSSPAGGMLHPQDGKDLLAVGMHVDLFNIKRELLGQGVIASFRVDSGEDFVQVDFPSGPPSEDPLPPGTVLVERPVYVTFRVNNGSLDKCVSWTYPVDCDAMELAGKFNRTPTFDDPETVYHIATDVVDMQLSYFVLSSADKDWITRPAGEIPRVDRLNVRAVKIELLVKSAGTDAAALRTQTMCDNNLVKTKYFHGDRIIDVGCDRYSYSSISTVVHIPNNIAFAGS